MKRRIICSIIVLLLLLPGAVFAQRSTGGSGPTTVRLTVQSNVRGAQVQVSPEGNAKSVQRGAVPFSLTIPKGAYNIRVSAEGYETANRSINLSANQTVNINLEPSTVALRVTSNVRGAQVQVLGSDLETIAARGTTTFSANLNKGSYRVNVSAPGYDSAFQNVNLQSNQSLNFNLVPSTFALRVTSNVPNAMVQVTGQGAQGISGNVTFNTELQRGSYKIVVSAPGYNTATRDLNVSRNQNININLTPSVGTVNLVIPTDFLDLRNGNPSGQVQVHIDGQLQNGNRTFQIRPGNHTIRVSSGAFNIQKNLNIQAGQTYDFEIFMDLRVKTGK